jgi:hypothetical protein
MRMQLEALLCGALLLSSHAAGQLRAQVPTEEVASRLARVLPADVADQVLRRIDETRARGLPADALAARALELSAKGLAPERVVQVIDQQAGYLEAARGALVSAGRTDPQPDEIDAGATALRKGVDGRDLSSLASSAPSARSLAVPLLVMSSLVDRGLPADNALREVLARIQARASDQQLERLADGPGVTTLQAPSALNGKDVAANRRPDVGRPDMLPTTAATKGNRPAATPPRPPGVARP